MTTLKFSGSGREYFRIWIVNFALTLSTLGVYSAWAKVKRLQYFYRHTRLDGFSFNYTGQPIAILKGRILAAALFVLYTMAGLFGPLGVLASFLALAAVMPWLLSRSLRFRLRNTCYRGLPFRFTGATRTAYWVFAVLPFLAVLSLFTAAPFAHHRSKRYQYRNVSYGRTPFSFDGRPGEFYVAWAVGVAVLIGCLILLIGAVFLIALLFAGMGRSGDPGTRTTVFWTGMVIGLLGYATTFVAVQAVVQSRIQNYIWAHTRLGPHAFRCDLKAGPLFRLLWGNLFATVFTLGLFRPFAQVRLAQYTVDAMIAVPAGDVGELAADESPEEIGAAGQEAADLFDFDIAF
jgi:uncharacterized membrane protein YjgN (DUF898 family)